MEFIPPIWYIYLHLSSGFLVFCQFFLERSPFGWYLFHKMNTHEFEMMIRERLSFNKDTSIGAARRAGLPRDAIRSVLRGHPPTLPRAAKICEALGLEFYVGPPRGEVATPEVADATPDVAPAWAQEIQGDLAEQLTALLKKDREDLTALIREVVSGQGIADQESRLGPPDEAGQREARAPNYIPDTPKTGAVLVEQSGEEGPTPESADVLHMLFAQHVRAAAGPGEAVFEEAADFGITIKRPVLPGWIRPSGLICIRATGDSMEPTLYEGDLIILDRSQTEPVAKEMFVVRDGDGLVIKRLKRVGRGWRLVSDNPAYSARKVGKEDRIIGRVAWTGTLEKRDS